MAYLKKYWTKYKWLFILSVACVSGEAICDLTQPKIMSRLIDEGAVKGDLDYVLRTSLLMLGIAGLGAVFAFTRNISASYASQEFGAELRLDLFSKIQSLETADMDSFDGGSLVTRMTNDITQVQNFINGMMRIFFKAPIMCAGAIIMATTLNLRVLPVIAPVVLIVAAVIAASMRMSYPRFAKVQEAIDKLNTTMREYLSGIRLVKAFRRFGEEEKRFAESNDLLTDNTVKANNVLSIFTPCMSLTVNFGIAAIIFFGARWIDMEDMQVGQIMAFVTYMTQMLGSLNMISNILNMFVRVKSSNRRINEVMSIKSEKNTAPNRVRQENIKSAHITFDNVGFEYRGSTGQAALSDLNFSVARGETIGIIGPTGSGKSTAAALLMRFYEASRGEMRISDAPIADTPESLLREKIAIVPQTATLFSGTVMENIMWGKGDATAAEVEEAAVAAEAHGFISAMPDGYHTVIGQSGVNLSGGQKQRLSIARALVRKPEILILDDCTSALDAVTEAKVKRAIHKLPITCVLITQRINTAMSCDKILVLDSGKQAGIGSHDELMANCPVYRDIYLSQIGEGAVANGTPN